MSIIISETVDAADYYDGFGTGEIVIGIRAYQWGWEYFYPKNIDLNYNVRPSYSSFLGNSIKYNNTSSHSLDSNVLWKHYQKKNNTSQLNTPAHVILSPNDNNNSLNFIDFSNVGNSISKDSSAFKKIQKFSKLSLNNISKNVTFNNQVFTKINNTYLNASNINNNSYNYGTTRQHNFASMNTNLPSFSTLVDNNSFKKFTEYTLNSKTLENKSKLNTTVNSYSNMFSPNLESSHKINGFNLLTLSQHLNSDNKRNYLDSFFLK